MPALSTSDVSIIEGLRGLAVFNVILLHSLTHYIDSHFILGLLSALAVPIFFCISGFCICHGIFQRQLNKEQILSSSFVKRRFHRIYPPYLLAVIIFAIKVIGLEYYRSHPISFSEILQMMLYNVFLIQVLMADTIAINPAFWSLCVEVQFYTCVALILWIYNIHKKLGLVVIASLFLACLTIKILQTLHVIDIPSRVWFSLFPNYVIQFALGASLAWWHIYARTNKLFSAKHPYIVMTLLLCIVLASTTNYGWIIALLFTACIWADKTGGFPLLRRLFNQHLLRFIGIRSYSIYLTHMFCIAAVSSFGARQLNEHFTYGISIFVANIAFIILLGSVYYELIEVRFLNKRFSSK